MLECCKRKLEFRLLKHLWHATFVIHFAANDCGYTGSQYDLIANWVHPLFLKSKTEASKEDNPRWKQAMSGPFKEEYWKDAIKEIESLELESMDVWKRSNSGRYWPKNELVRTKSKLMTPTLTFILQQVKLILLL